MIRSLVDISLRFRRLILALALGMVAFGIARIGDIRMDLLPEFSPTTVEVQTEALGLSAEEVEQFVTVPLEQDLLNGIAFLEEIDSASLPGLSSVVMTFEPGTDPLDARQVVAERLTQAVGAAGLPAVADLPQMLQPLSSMRRVAMISMTSPTQSQIEQSVLARWVVVPRLMGIEGVANVSIWGFRDRQLQVLVDPSVLADRGISMSDVVRTSGNALEVSGLTFLEASTPGTGGFIDTTNQRLHVFHEQAITSPDELAQVVVEDADGRPLVDNGEPVVLGDVATIVEDHQPLIGDARCGGAGCVLLVVEKFPGANTPEVAAQLASALEALRPGLGDVQFDASIYRPAEYIESARSNLELALLIGGLLALLFLAVVEWRTAVVAAASALAAVTAATLVLDARQSTVNTMVLVGLSAGLVVVVVDAVVVARALLYNRAWHGPDVHAALLRRTLADAVIPARSGAIYAFLVAVALLTPFFFMSGAAGAFFPEIASTYLLAVGSQLIVGLMVTSAVGMLLTERLHDPVAQGALELRVRRWYREFGTRSFGSVGRGVAVLGVFVLAAAAVVPTLDVSFAPDLAERDVVIELEAAPGASLPRMSEIVSDITGDLVGVSGIARVTAQIGRAIRSDQIANVNRAEMWVNLAEGADQRSTVDAIRGIVAGRTDVTAHVSTYSSGRIDEVLGRPQDEFTVRVYGDDAGVLRASAEIVRSAVGAITGIENARLEPPIEEPTIQVDVDLERTAAVGIKPGDVRRTAAMLLSGITVGNLFERQKVFDVVVWGAPELRSSVQDVEALPILLPGGGQVALGELADVRVVPNPAVIRHESVQRFIDVRVDVVGRDLAGVAADVESAIDDLQFDLGYRAAVVGGFAAEQAGRTRVMSIAIAAVGALFLLLQAALGSWRLASIGLFGLPMAASGGILATRFSGGTVGLGEMAGLVTVVTLATLWMVLLIRRFQHRRRAGEGFGIDFVVTGSEAEVVSGLWGVASAVLIALPMATMAGTTGLEVVGPMAAVVLGGLVTTAALVFYLLPAAYLRWGGGVAIDTDAEDLFALDLREAATVGRA